MNTSHRNRVAVRSAAYTLGALLLLVLLVPPPARAADAGATSVPAPAANAPSATPAPAVPSATANPAGASDSPAAPAAPAVAAPATGAPAAASPSATSAGADSANTTRSLDEQVQDLKKSTLQLNRDLFILEEELLFPANTQVAVFVSVDVGDFFALDSINLKIDNREVSNYLYTPREVSALLKGGVQRLYVGNLKSGMHEMVAFFNGKGPNERYYRRAASIRFEKGVGAKYLELKVTDRAHAQQPEFEIKDWE